MDKFSEFLHNERQACESRGEKHASSRTRKNYCPNYIIPSLVANYYDYNFYGPRAGIDYNPWTKRPITNFCDHNNCQPYAEYEFALIELYVRNEITHMQWRSSRPQTKSCGGKTRQAQNWCFGNTLKQFLSRARFNNVSTNIPETGHGLDTVSCSHEEMECLRSNPAVVSIHRLVECGQLSKHVLTQIVMNGWAEKCQQAWALGLDPVCTFFHVDMKFDYSHLWRPFMIEDWFDMQENQWDELLDTAKCELRNYLFLKLKSHKMTKTA